MKDIAILESEIDHLVHELAKAKNDREFLLRFVARLLHPEEFGWSVDQEVRKEARFVLDQVTKL
jgi:hypothetical protein